MLLFLTLLTNSMAAEIKSEFIFGDDDVLFSNFTRKDINVVYQHSGMLCVETNRCDDSPDRVMFSNATDYGSITEALLEAKSENYLAVFFPENSTFDWTSIYKPSRTRQSEKITTPTFVLNQTNWDAIVGQAPGYFEPIQVEIKYYNDCTP